MMKKHPSLTPITTSLLILAASGLSMKPSTAADYFHLGMSDRGRIDRAKEFSNTDGDTAPATTEPGAGDDLFFFNSALTAPFEQTLYTGAGREGRSRSYNSMTFRANAGPTQIDRSPSGDEDPTVLAIGAGGISIEPGAGPVTFGRPVDGDNPQRVIVGAAADLKITNNSGNDLTFNRFFDSRTEHATHTVTVTGSGSGNTVFVEGIRSYPRKGQDLAMTIDTTGSGVVRFEGLINYTGATNVTSGKLFINGNATAATGPVGVSSDATLGGNGTVGGDVSIAENGCLEFVISTPAASHDPMDLATSLTFAGASELAITSPGGAAVGKYTLVSSTGGVFGTAPATVKLPDGWAGKVSIAGNDLVLDVTAIGPP
jgi:autotransporter-associated beta strand protein